ncbi:hypothetical protein BGZ70_005582, partial [Mortierella alpina]
MNAVPSPTATALTRNLGHIREVIFPDISPSRLQLLIQGLPNQLNDTVTEPGSRCTHLTRIYLNDLDLNNVDHIRKPLLTLFNNNLRLTHLDVVHEVFGIAGALTALSKLQHLQHLTVRSTFGCGILPEPLSCLRCWLALPELTELHLGQNVEMYWNDGDEMTVRRQLEAVIHEAS